MREEAGSPPCRVSWIGEPVRKHSETEWEDTE